MDNQELFALSEAEISENSDNNQECRECDCNCVDDCAGADGDGNG
jgi:hypothetical protein